MKINSLVIEVTRKCNMKCGHCLRGSIQNVNQTKENIDLLLDQVTEIGGVTFTGGEPSLNIPIMEYFLSEVKRRQIYVGFFYIATNGLRVPDQFVIFTMKMYSYCECKEMCAVHVSNDVFHKEQGQYDISLLSVLSYVGKKYQREGENFRQHNLIAEGRAKTLYNSVKLDKIPDVTIENIQDGTIDFYLNCKGEIINGCDWSYSSQRKHKICDVADLGSYKETIPETIEEFC